MVKKIGIDPHWSYANQLCEVAWARAHGTAAFFIPEANNQVADRRVKAATTNLAGLPPQIMMIEQGDHYFATSCGACSAYPVDDLGQRSPHAVCQERHCKVGARDPGCVLCGNALKRYVGERCRAQAGRESDGYLGPCH